MRFSDTLRRLINERKIQQKSLALAIDISPATVSQWLSEKREPNSYQRKKLSEFFKVSEAELFGGISVPVNPTEKIPVISWASGGEEIDIKPAEFKDKFIEFHNCKAIEIMGDSMSPVCYNGQKIIYSEAGIVNDGDLVYIGLKDGNKYFKRYYKDRKNNIITLQPINVANHHGPKNIQERDIKFIYKVVGISYI